MTSSTPDVLWAAPSLRALRPAAVAWSGLRRGRLLDGCTLSVPAGARLLLVSDPPASASLLLRILAGLSPAGGGRIELAGSSDPSADGWARRVAYLGPESGIRGWMTPREVLRLAADLLDLPPSIAARRTDEVVAWCRLGPGDLDRPVRRAGASVDERTGLAAALLGDPEVLLVDGALRSLDRAERRRLLRLPGERRTVLLASRHPEGEAGIVGHAALLRGGRVTLVARVAELAAARLPLSREGLRALADVRQAASRSDAGPARTAGSR